jgi:hypothetical protein
MNRISASLVALLFLSSPAFAATVTDHYLPGTACVTTDTAIGYDAQFGIYNTATSGDRRSVWCPLNLVGVAQGTTISDLSLIVAGRNPSQHLTCSLYLMDADADGGFVESVSTGTAQEPLVSLVFGNFDLLNGTYADLRCLIPPYTLALGYSQVGSILLQY